MFFGIFKGRNEYGLSLIIFSFASFFMLPGLSSVSNGKSTHKKPQKKSMMAQVDTLQADVPHVARDFEASPLKSIKIRILLPQPAQVVAPKAIPPLAIPMRDILLPDVLPQEPAFETPPDVGVTQNTFIGSVVVDSNHELMNDSNVDGNSYFRDVLQ